MNISLKVHVTIKVYWEAASPPVVGENKSSQATATSDLGNS